MKKLRLGNWLAVGAMGAAVLACQIKKDPTSSEQEAVPCVEDDCPAPPESSYEDKVPCREDECDTQEGGEEAMIHVIEISDPAEQNSSANVAPSSDDSSAQPDSLNAEAEEFFESAEMTLDPSSSPEEPTTHIFDDFPTSPISESKVVLSVKE